MTPKSVLITGCSAGGIGFAMVEAFQKRGLHVFATVRNPFKMSKLEKLINVTLLSLDPTSTDSVQTAVGTVRAKTGGRLDYLVKNAGQTIIIPTLDFDIETAKKMYDINVWGMVRVTQEFAPLHVAVKGTLCDYALDGRVYEGLELVIYFLTNAKGVYTRSKAAMTAITEALHLELAPLGVTVVTVNTGAVSTNTLATGADFKLPPTSMFKSTEKEVAGRARGHTPRMEASMYAEKVVSDVLRGASGQIWRGGYASIVRFVLSKLPTSISDWIFIQKTGLDVLKSKIHYD